MGGLVISVAVPVQRYKQVLGAVMLSTGSGEIEEELRTVRLELLRIFGRVAGDCTSLALPCRYDRRPVRRLAPPPSGSRPRCPRRNPDFTARGDEIGELSVRCER